MSVVPDRLTGQLAARHAQFRGLLVSWQEPVVTGVRRTVAFVDGRLPREVNLPGLPTVHRPAPEGIVRRQFAAAERLLEANKRLVLSLVGAPGADRLDENAAAAADDRNDDGNGVAEDLPAGPAKAPRPAKRAPAKRVQRPRSA